MTSLVNLVLSLSDLFDHIYEREGVVKRVFLYQQRRFAQLGKAAASLVEALPILRKVIDEADHTNQLIESCNFCNISFPPLCGKE